MSMWMIHKKDGTTLTDADCYPHEVDSELITSVERNVGGWVMTILKSPYIEGFFIGSEASIDFMFMGPGAGTARPAETTKRILGCYIKNTDPPIQCQFVMDPRTHDTLVDFFEVNVKAPEGIKARRLQPRAKGIVEIAQRPWAENFHGLVKSSLITEVVSTPQGWTCILEKPNVRAELIIQKNNTVLLGFGRPDQKLVLKPG